MFNKKIAFILSTAAVCCYLGTGTASAQTNDTAVVTYEVESITQLGLTGAASVKIVAGTAGQGLPSVTDSTGVTYDITNNAGADSKKLIGKINTSMPANTVLSVNVTAPSGALSADFVALTTSDQDLVTGIDNVNESGVAISFKLEATVAAGVIASATKTFTMTIVAS
ncbi:MAG TPA: hypothetical protein VMZ90_08800 [Vicinamibacterales bacterium]|nr:hypothetical protein [Vicinamibacterales bacterium]